MYSISIQYNGRKWERLEFQRRRMLQKYLCVTITIYCFSSLVSVWFCVTISICGESETFLVITGLWMRYSTDIARTDGYGINRGVKQLACAPVGIIQRGTADACLPVPRPIPRTCG